jgi:hypothetical protein
MTSGSWWAVAAVGGLAGLAGLAPLTPAAHAQARPAAATTMDRTVPADLAPLLTPRRSEMRLVVTRYQADRALLAGNYAGPAAGPRGGRGPGAAGQGAPAARPDSAGRAAPAGRAAAAPDSTLVPVSPARIARLRRFGLSWQTALARLDPSALSPAARTDLDALRASVRSDLARLDAEEDLLADVSPFVPFAPALVGLVEARIRVEDLDAQQAAGTVVGVTEEIAALRARLASAEGAGALRPSREQALRAAVATTTLRENLVNWFRFYDGYDPQFTWWVRLPYRDVDAALARHAAFLRDTVALRSAPGAGVRPVARRSEPAPPTKYGEVPVLAELIALPQDEMTGIVQRFIASGGTGRTGGRGGPGATPPPEPDARFYRDWLSALRTLDFARLSRNAQVDYLYLKKIAELRLARVGTTLPADPPRKADASGIPGPARGREGLIRDLQDELIPYTPEQLIALAEREFAWVESEMRKASRQMGFGDDWKKALEKTKTMHVPPGGQPAMIRDLIVESIDYLRAKDLLTMPEVDAESQRMIMMTPERQLVNPFFTGGSQISVSYPTDSMPYRARLESMRGNNRPWSHATAGHEMIPGHNLVGYYGQRFGDYRASLGAGGPFFGEGWPVYWETILYDKGFHDTPEERVGALFWRMHRCARIIFSLRFHMGQWSPQESIDFLVDRAGHERANATAEVRRSFQGGYGPLYQAAYLLGALQLRGLRGEIVDARRMPEKAFHDEILRQGSMPIALLRLALGSQPLTPDTSLDWRFYGELPDR